MSSFLAGNLQDYLDALASGEPTPGGGSAAGLSGAMGAALLCMSARFTIGREKYAAFSANAEAVLAEADVLRGELQQLMDADAAAYGQYRAASALPKSTDDEKATRRAALQAATRASGEAPLAIARACLRLLELAGVLAANCNPYLVSDVVVATECAQAGLHSAVINVRMNLATLDDPALQGAWTATLALLTSQAPRLAKAALTAAYAAMQLPLEGDYPA